MTAAVVPESRGEPEGAVALGVESLRVHLGGREILAGVDLVAERGRVTAVLGPSGAGKTTLFRALAGELVPTSGCVRLNGADATDLPLWKRARQGLGYVPQAPSVLFDLTVAQNLDTFVRAARSRANPGDLAHRVGLDERLGLRAGDLSGGERRRLELARALAGEPSVLVCDEPFSAVDPARTAGVARLLRGLADDGAAVILADHRVPEALDIADVAHLLVDGRIEVSVSPGAFSAHPAVRRRYLG